MQKIGIVGSRRRDSDKDFFVLKDAFFEVFQPGDQIISGGCPKGGDRFAEVLALHLGSGRGCTAFLRLGTRARQIHLATNPDAPITIHEPRWKEHGKRAGFIRNAFIAEDSDILLALPAADRTGGTEDTIRRMTGLRKPVTLL